MFRLLILFAISLALIGCKSDPYEDLGEQRDGGYGQQEDERLVTADNQQGPKPARPDRPVRPLQEDPDEIKDLIGISVDDFHTFVEGQTKAIPFSYTVSEGEAILRIEGLEKLPGAYHDAEKGEIIWRPGYYAANMPLGKIPTDNHEDADPTINSSEYSFDIVVTSSAQPLISRVRTINIKVVNYRRPLQISNDGDVDRLRLVEGQKKTKNFEIADTDYPDGPFEFYADDIDYSSMVKSDPNDPKKFFIELDPGYGSVKLNGNAKDNGSCRNPSSRCEISFNKKFYVRAPDGHIAEKELEVRIRDVRQDPLIVVPKVIEQAGEISFNVDVIDPNEEVVPSVVLVNPITTFGSTPLFQEVKKKAEIDVDFRKSMVLRYEDITQEFIGESERLTFRACVMNSNRDSESPEFSYCENRTVNVIFTERARKAPVIARDSWNFEDIIYIKRNDTRRVSLPISVLDEDDAIQSVEITKNKNSSSNIRWDRNAQELIITSKSDGLQYFTLTVVSRYGMKSTESFVFEGLPLAWESNLYMGESQNDKDLGILKRASNSVKIVNPEIMALDDRLYEERDLLVAGTALLKDAKLSEKLVDMVSKVQNVLIMTPALDNLPEPIRKEIEKYDVALLGNLSKQSNALPLNELDLRIPRDIKLQNPEQGTQIKLNGKLTDFSNDPMTFIVGDLAGSKCSALFSLRKTIQNSFTVGVQCVRDNGGLLTLIGFEPGDIATLDPVNNEIDVNWVKSLMSGDYLLDDTITTNN